MPSTRGQKNYINLTKGLTTEINPLAFPENASVDEDNMQVDFSKLSRLRRTALTTEGETNNLIDLGSVSTTFSVFMWKNPSNDTSRSFLVVEAGDYLAFFNGRVESDISGSQQLFGYDLTNSQVSSPSVRPKTRYQFTVADGALVVVGLGIDPTLIQWDGTTITADTIQIKIRDTKGIDDGLEISERPFGLTEAHDYNLNNQGWYQDRRTEGSGTTYNDVKTQFSTDISLWPSNADISHLGLKVDEDGDERFDSFTLADQTLGNSLAPRGHYVFNAWSIDRDERRLDPSIDGTSFTTLTSQPIGGPL